MSKNRSRRATLRTSPRRTVPGSPRNGAPFPPDPRSGGTRLGAGSAPRAGGRLAGKADPPALVVQTEAVLAPRGQRGPTVSPPGLKGQGPTRAFATWRSSSRRAREAWERDTRFPRGRGRRRPRPARGSGIRFARRIYTQICDCMGEAGPENASWSLRRVPVGRGGAARTPRRLVVPGAVLEVELDPLEAVLVGMGPEAGPEAADLAVDGRPVAPGGLETSKPPALCQATQKPMSLASSTTVEVTWSRRQAG